MDNFTIALDWTPNTLHSGILLARDRGFFQDVGIKVSIVSPADDKYTITPGKKLALQEVHLALCPSESVISYQTTSPPVPIKAVAAILREDGSAIASLTASRPSELVGKVYASYSARFEDGIVQKMVDNDSGASAGQIKISTPSKLGIYDTLLNGSADATWIFEAWEAILAKRAGHTLHTFKMADYGISYGYSPVLAINEQALKKAGYSDLLRRALSAISKGYEKAMSDPTAAAEAVVNAAGDLDLAFVNESQIAINRILNLQSGFGYMQAAVWENFITFLQENKLLVGRDGKSVNIRASSLWSNDYLAA